MEINERRVDIAVVGAGLAGLGAAITAARGGATVAVLERSRRAGGRAASHESQGFTFNLGPHALYPLSKRLLQQLGVSVQGDVPPLTGYALVDGQLIPMPAGPLALLDGPLFTPVDRDGVQSAFRSIPSLPAVSLGGVSLSSWLDRLALQGRARQFIQSLARLATYVDAPDDFSAGAALAQMQDAAQGVIYPDGGWQTIALRLRATAVEAGASVVEGSPIRAVQPASAGFRVLLADGTSIAADRVILALPPEAVRRLLPREWTDGVVPDAAAAVSLAALDLGLTRLPNREGGFVLALDRPLYLSVHSLAARLAPPRGATISVARYLKPGEATRPALVLEELEAFLDAVQPGWRPLEAARQYLPSITVANSMPRASTGGLHGRPGPTALGVPGLYLAGDWVGSEGLLSAASLSSGIAAARLALATGEFTALEAVQHGLADASLQPSG